MTTATHSGSDRVEPTLLLAAGETPTGSGPTGSGPTGSGPTGSGMAGAGRVESRRTGLLRLLAAVVGGSCLGLSFEPYGLWPLLFAGIAMLTLAVRGARLRRAFGLGYLAGLAMLGLAISWIHVLGWWIAVALIAFVALYLGLLGLAIGLVSRLRWWPVSAAVCWVMVEFAYARWPFGGFGWTRIAYAAVDTPLAGFFPVVGVAGVSFVAALVGQLIAWTVVGLRGRRIVVGAASLAVLLAGGAALRAYEPEPLDTGAQVRVGIVQGNVPGRGIEALGRARSVTNNHLSETVDLATRWRLGQVAEPDFILWPENSTDIDPLADAVTGLTVSAATEVAGKPILVGAVTRGPGADERQTTAMWWNPQGRIEATYHKRNLVPFGEWIPFRTQLLPLIPLLAQTGAQSVPGSTPGVLDVQVDGRRLLVGDVICFELAYDQTVYDTIRGGAQVSVVQSNNATYGGTGQIEQQFAITRARAMEARREIAVATTNSVSGFIDRDGRVVTRTQEFTNASTVVTMPLRSAITPAMVVAPLVDRGLALAGLLLCLIAVVVSIRRHRRGRASTAATEPGEPGEPGGPVGPVGPVATDGSTGPGGSGGSGSGPVVVSEARDRSAAAGDAPDRSTAAPADPAPSGTLDRYAGPPSAEAGVRPDHRPGDAAQHSGAAEGLGGSRP